MDSAILRRLIMNLGDRAGEEDKLSAMAVAYKQVQEYPTRDNVSGFLKETYRSGVWGTSPAFSDVHAGLVKSIAVYCLVSFSIECPVLSPEELAKKAKKTRKQLLSPVGKSRHAIMMIESMLTIKPDDAELKARLLDMITDRAQVLKTRMMADWVFQQLYPEEHMARTSLFRNEGPARGGEDATASK